MKPVPGWKAKRRPRIRRTACSFQFWRGLVLPVLGRAEAGARAATHGGVVVRLIVFVIPTRAAGAVGAGALTTALGSVPCTAVAAGVPVWALHILAARTSGGIHARVESVTAVGAGDGLFAVLLTVLETTTGAFVLVIKTGAWTSGALHIALRAAFLPRALAILEHGLSALALLWADGFLVDIPLALATLRASLGLVLVPFCAWGAVIRTGRGFLGEAGECGEAQGERQQADLGFHVLYSFHLFCEGLFVNRSVGGECCAL